MLLLLALCAAPAAAQLTADEIVVVAVAGSEGAKKVAEHYAKARSIPADRILYLNVKPGADLRRSEYHDKVKPAIRAFLTDKKLADKVRCLVTVYDCPLRVGRHEPTPDEQKRVDLLNQRLNAVIDEALELTAKLDRLAADPLKPEEPAKKEPAKDDKKAEPVKAPPRPTAQAATKAAVNSLRNAETRVGKMAEGPAKGEAVKALLNAVAELGGLEELSRRLRPRAAAADAPPGAKVEFERLNQELASIQESFRKLMTEPDSPERFKKAEDLLRRGPGIAGLAMRFSAEREAASARETEAALDSELSLLWWDEYPLYRWIMNTLHHRFDGAPEKPKSRVLLVARLETPTVERTLKMIDDAVETEKVGLTGKVYIDARGLNADKSPGSYGDYDEALRRLAAFLKEKTKLEVVLDNKSELFAPGTCPDAALYCGWYALARYVDAFTWNRGAVGYHIASSEATTLRNPGSTVWCKRMVELGVCGTMGPVAEPYLTAFCRPDEFFPMLLTGKYAAVECYYRTLNFNSWMNIYVGDPLYRPFLNKPHLKVEDLPGRLALPAGWGK